MSVKTVDPAVIWTGTNGMLSFPMTGAMVHIYSCTQMHAACTLYGIARTLYGCVWLAPYCNALAASLCPTSPSPAPSCTKVSHCSMLSTRGLAYASGLVHTSRLVHTGLDWCILFDPSRPVCTTSGLVHTGELMQECCYATMLHATASKCTK